MLDIGAELKTTILEALIDCFIGNPEEFGEKVIALIKEARSIPDMILWTNLYYFLQEGDFDYGQLRKLSAKLEESGNRHDNAARIVYTINKIDDPKKAGIISHLTQSVINSQIDLALYFRLIKAVDNMIYSDMQYLSENVEKTMIDSEDEHIDDFLANGLIYSIDGGFAYTDKSYDLVEYGISRGKSIRRPSQKPDRQILSVMPEADIDAMFENN